jgi:hypothetical protein
MSISNVDDGIDQHKKMNVELQEDHGEDVLHEDPELGLTFDTENEVQSTLTANIVHTCIWAYVQYAVHRSITVCTVRTVRWHTIDAPQPDRRTPTKP